MPAPLAPPPSAAHRLRGLGVNLALSLAVTVAFAGALESWARWTEVPAPALPLADTHGLDWQAEWEGDFHVVKSDAVGWPPTQDFNRDGFRDRFHPLEKPPHTYRVAGLGDSVTLGYGFPRGEAWPQALQQMVDARGPGIEVFNAAEVGWSTRQERYAYERIVRRYRPDLVVLAYVLNDLEDLENNLSQPPRLLLELFKRSALVRRIADAQGREIRSVEELFHEPEPAKVTSGYRRLFDEMRRLADEVHADGARLVVLICPDADQVGPHPPPPIPQQRMAAFLRAQGLPAIDVLDALKAIGPPAFMDRIHFTPAGSRRVAEMVLDAAVPVPTDATTPAARQAVWALGRRSVADPAAMKTLAAALDDPDLSVRLEASRALALLGPAGRDAPEAGARTQARLVAMLGDTSQAIRWSVADALFARGLKAGEDVPWLIGALGNPDPYVRGFAVWQIDLSGRAAEPAVPALETLLHDPEPGIRILAVRTLGNVGRRHASVVASLADVVAHGTGDGRWRAARALGKLGPAASPAVAALARALSDPDEKLRTESALALERIGPSAEDAVTALVAAEHDTSATVREAAQSAIRTITASR